jgi:putative acetyltransferase
VIFEDGDKRKRGARGKYAGLPLRRKIHIPSENPAIGEGVTKKPEIKDKRGYHYSQLMSQFVDMKDLLKHRPFFSCNQSQFRKIWGSRDSKKFPADRGIILKDDQTMIELVRVDTPEKIEKTRKIFRQYARFVDFDLSFQGFAEELASLPGDYSSPAGGLLLAQEGNETAGCVALRKIGDGICEMKRLFVSPQHRGSGIGRILADAIIKEAQKLGYKRMRLDTVPPMTSAIGLYRSLGFEEIPPYCHNPVPGAKFFELQLEPGGSANDST